MAVVPLEIDGETFLIDKSMVGSAIGDLKAVEAEKKRLPYIRMTLAAVGVFSLYFGYFTYLMLRLLGLVVLAGIGFYLFMMVGEKLKSGWAWSISAKLIPKIMKKADNRLRLIRSELLKNVKGKCLDVGCSTGHYIRYFKSSKQKVTSLTMLEPNKNMIQGLKENIAKSSCPFPVYIRTDYLEDIKEEGSFDSILFGNVLCEIPDYKAAIRKAHRLLKPGGRVYFSEHVLDEPGTTRRILQRLVQHWWLVVSGGCDCARDSLVALKEEAHWKEVKSWTIFCGTFPWTSKFEVGIAVK